MQFSDIFDRSQRVVRKKAKISILIFFHTIHLATHFMIQDLEKLTEIGAEKYVTQIYDREKDKWSNKGSDKQYLTDSLLFSTTGNPPYQS